MGFSEWVTIKTNQGPFMKTLPLSEAKSHLSALVKRVHDLDEEVNITVNGRPAAVLISPDQLEGLRETVAIQSDPELMRQIRRGIKALKEGKYKVYTDLDELFGK
mgnify:CR=1 FL=1